MDEQSTTGAPAGLIRRLAALFYDTLLIVALLFIVTFAMLPLTGGEAILNSTQGTLGHLYHALLVLAGFAYFGFSWTHGGQTLGMKAWRMRLATTAGSAPNWADALVRFTIGLSLALLAALGLWYLSGPGWSIRDFAALLMLLPALANLAWIRFDECGRSLQDLAGGLVVRRLG
ncbi:MAG: RDD family protein [Steroidobacteraceae bacterium]